ncbi:hypothetical protein B0A48_07665 [Cryoendolithus antarcticus]|uniref:Uncharacterized protein n=1 Tax=Cryoendolithus antarcticus TaxID=1507870 RepID=A0A1V8T6S1_9PEZI|nr:hypothetical protein B0A48_07665 [Cryoendolithus antarcticus]
MGLFVTEDGGHYKGWLAALLCCCAAVTEDEHPAERAKERATPSKRAEVCNEEPPLTALPSIPTAHYKLGSNGEKSESGSQDVDDDYATHSRHSLKPLDLGSSSLLPRHEFMYPDARTRSLPRLTAHVQHHALVPLQLGPVVLRDAPDLAIPPEAAVPRPRQRSDSTQHLLGDAKRESYLESRETPFQRCSRSSTDMLNTYLMPAVGEQAATRVAASTKSSSSSLRRQALESKVTSSTPRTPTDSTRASAKLKRKRSDQSNRKGVPSTTEHSIEQEILELNTIVEERRAESRGKPFSGHVPAVAPAMEVRARSETLNDIGSAFSRPLTSREVPHRLNTFELETRPARPATSRARSRSSNRVSGWLSGIMNASGFGSAPSSATADEPFYRCQPSAAQTRPLSQTSMQSSMTEPESPALTLASSPTATSKGYTHSRSLTAESRLTPLLPVEMLYGGKIVEDGGTWRVSSPSQVGVAM